MSGITFGRKDLSGWGLDLTGWNFVGQDLSKASLAGTTLTDTDFTDAVVMRASFGNAIGLTSEQLYSTSSYKVNDDAKNLLGIKLAH